MKEKDSGLPQRIAAHLHGTGYVLLPAWRPEETTITLAQCIGTVVDMSATMPQSGVPTVQTLRPRNTSDSSSNSYSGTYGLGEFPLHTDLAHWAQPPRYFLLRCVSGAEGVFTKLLPIAGLLSQLETLGLRRALSRPRRPTRAGVPCLLPLLFSVRGTYGLRWDPLFLVPMNASAQQVAQVMSNGALDRTKLVKLALRRPGDTLVVDNWRILHGRTSVYLGDMTRLLERVYISELRA